MPSAIESLDLALERLIDQSAGYDHHKHDHQLTIRRMHFTLQ